MDETNRHFLILISNWSSFSFSQVVSPDTSGGPTVTLGVIVSLLTDTNDNTWHAQLTSLMLLVVSRSGKS